MARNTGMTPRRPGNTSRAEKGGSEGYLNRVLIGDTEKPVNVTVEMVSPRRDTMLMHRLNHTNDFDAMDFYLPLGLLFLIFVVQFMGGFLFSLFLQVILVLDLFKRVRRRPANRAAVGFARPFASCGWGFSFLVYGLSVPVIAGAIWLNLSLMHSFFPDSIGTPFGQEQSEEFQFNPEEFNFEEEEFNPDTFNFDGEGMDADGAGDIPEAFLFDSPSDAFFGLAAIMPLRIHFRTDFLGSALLTGLIAMGLITILIMFVTTVILAPITEELWFRGIGNAGLMQKSGSRIRATVLTSVIFGMLHGPSRIMFTTIFGFILSFIRFRTGSLYCCIVIHMLHNLLAVVLEMLIIIWMLTGNAGIPGS